MKKNIAVLFLFSLGLLVMSCGGGGGGTDGGKVRVAVSPATANVIAGQTQQFTASVTGALNSTVAWTVSCSTSSCGTISGSGLYTAPALIPSDTTVTVKAISQEDTNIVGTATVTQSAVAVSISPNSSLTLISADTKQFTVSVDDAPSGHTTATWSVSGGGTIDANGLYSAPAKVTADATVTVTATSDFDSAKKASVTVTLKAPVITLAPGDMTMEAGAAQQFTPTVSYVPAGQNGVSWSVDGLGSIAAGMYTAPILVTTHHAAIIKAISAFDTTKSAQSVVTMDPIVIGVIPDSVTLYPEDTHQFSATVVNHVNKTVTWSVTGTSCGGGACGTVDANGLYTAPSSIASEFTVNVVATSVADNSKTDVGLVSLKPITVTVSPKTASVKVTTTQQFSASVQGGTNTNVTWSVSGSGCSGNACGTINATGFYTAPATVPTPATVAVKAAAVADPTRFDTATVTLIYDPNVKLNGTFAFNYSGWDQNGKGLDAIGSMVADGNGHITGLIDMNGVNTAYRRIKEAFTGTYEVNASDNRGQMVFNLSTGARTFRFGLSSTGDRGYFILFESSGLYGSGLFKRQTTSDFSQSTLAGDWALGMVGMSSMGNERNGAAGRMHLDNAGAISNTMLDVVNTGEPSAVINFSGAATINSGTGMASGRGTLSVTTQEGTINLSFYMVNANESFIMISDTIGSNSPLLIGRVARQIKPTFGETDFTGKSVFYMTGIVSQTVTKSAVTIGQFDSANGSATAYYTRNWAGGVFSGSSTGGYEVYANGRTLWGSAAIGDFVIYLIGPNTGFILQTNDTGNLVQFGFFEPQSGNPFSNSMLNGEYVCGALDSAVRNVPLGHGIQSWNGSGGWSGVGSVADPNSGNYPDMSLAGSYIVADANIGVGNWEETSPGTDSKKFYVISPNKMVMVSTDTEDLFPWLEIIEK